MANRFPRGDAEFQVAMNQFHTYINSNLAKLNLTQAKSDNLGDLKDDFDAAYDLQQSLDAQKRAATMDKNAKRELLEDAATRLVNSFASDEGITPATLVEMGFDPRDTEPTPIGVPTTRPIGKVDTSQRLEHRIEFIDETSTTTGSRAKPEGVRGCEIWGKIGGAPPVDLSECRYFATDTSSPYLVNSFTGADAGKTVYYILRWVNTKSQPGPISETVTATITN